MTYLGYTALMTNTGVPFAYAKLLCRTGGVVVGDIVSI